MITVYEGKMTPRERVTRTFHHEIPDRVPIDYSTNPTVHARLAEALGLPAKDMEGMRRALGVDFRGADPGYTGPALFEPRPDRHVDPVSGIVTRWVANESGGYWDYCDFPLQNAEPEVIAAFPVASPDDFDYETCVERIKAMDAQGYAVYIGGAGHGDIINKTGMVMGMEDTLVNLASEDEATLAYIDRVRDLQLATLERVLEKAAEHITFVWLGEDLGTQHTPMISLPMYRKILRPRHQRYVDLAKRYDKPVMVHTCGSSSWVYEDFIEMGIDAVDTLQPEATNMSPGYLKENFGGRLAFHGCISTAGPLAYGTADEVEKTVKETLEVMMPGGGYMLAPTHAIQDNTPVENIITMYRAAHELGRY